VQLSKKKSRVKLPPMPDAISKEDFQAAFKAVLERTTSSSSGLYYSIWKVLARENDIAEWLSIMVSLPFQHSFVNDRWTTEVDMMIENKRDERKIHQPRIIGILETDFNKVLKILFSRRLMNYAEACGLSDEKWGFCSNRTSTDAAAREMLRFEYGRYMKMTISLFANDQSA